MWRVLPRTLRGPEGGHVHYRGHCGGTEEEDGVKGGSFVNLLSHDLMDEGGLVLTGVYLP